MNEVCRYAILFPSNRIWSLLFVVCTYFCNSQVYSQQPVPGGYPGIIRVNYVRTWNPSKAEANSANLTMSTALAEAKVTTQYLDGFGRPIQTIIKQGSLVTDGAAVDMVSPVVYDELGRTTYRYLPFAANNAGNNSSLNDGLFKMNPFQQQAKFYSDANTNNPVSGQDETWYYAQTNFEKSPLARVLESFEPGNSWVGSSTQLNEADRRSIKSKYWFNTTVDDVKKWTVTNIINSWGTYTVTGIYPPGSLVKSIVVDEKGKQVIEFRDKDGRIILKKVQLTADPDTGAGKNYTGWLSTYYIYDDEGNLRCVVQPEGVRAILSTWNLSTILLNEQCFRYEYDARRRMIIKKVPGAAELYMIYDRWDRLILTQDGNQRLNNTWLFIKYDRFNRPIMTGLHFDAINIGIYNVISHVAANESWQTRYEEYDAGKLHKYTTTQTYPYGTDPDALTVTYYDDYAWITGSGLSSNFNTSFNNSLISTYNTAPDYAQPVIQNNVVKGMVTGAKVKILGTPNYNYRVNIYDDKGRPIQVQSTNITFGTDILTTQYNWTGQPLINVFKQQKAGSPEHVITTVTKMTYDDLGRLLTVSKSVNSTINGIAVNKPDLEIVRNEYDALGQLKTKKLGKKKDNGGNYTLAPLETLVYAYNIRGWLLGMNRDFIKDIGTAKFGFELAYDKRKSVFDNYVANTYNQEQYNGNIGGMIWKSIGDGQIRKYDFNYDAGNRLLKADFTQYSNGWNTTAGVDFTIGGDNMTGGTIKYDDNGNMLEMWQKGMKLTGSDWIDKMSYSYFPGSNKLQKVTDVVTTNNFLGDFTDKNTTASDYGYDRNGNMITDLNKRINGNTGSDLSGGGAILYNHLNLPYEINVMDNNNKPKGKIMYMYDASGARLKKITQEYPAVSNGNISTTTTTLYLEGTVFESRRDNTPYTNDYTDKLQFILHEEGRIRFKEVQGTIPASYEYDYLIKDHLGNVRMVLTDEQKIDKYPVATLETGYTQQEQQYYTYSESYITDAQTITGLPAYTNDNGIGNNPSNPAFQNSNSQYMYRLNSNEMKTGLGMTLKVMAGDRIDILGRSYYFQNNTKVNATNSAVPVLTLIEGLLYSTAAGNLSNYETATGLNAVPAINTPIGNFISQSTRNNSSYPQRPKAFINYILLDEQFRYVTGGFSSVSNTSSQLKQHFSELQNIAVTKSGYLYVYCSNESPVNVFFDNLQVVHTRGPVLEETHYYPFGLTMERISSKALVFGFPNNKYKFNKGNELQSGEFADNSGLDLYDAFNRMYDPQIGRFWQIDELADAYEGWTPYVFGENNPVLKNDPFGLDPEKSTADKPTELPNVTVVSIKGGLWAKTRFYYRLMDHLNSQGASIDNIVNDKLREQMYRIDGIVKHRERVAEMTRASDKVFLELASWVAPGGILTKLSKLKKLQHLAKLYNSKRGRFAVNSVIQFGVNGKNADLADIIAGTLIPGLKGLSVDVALDWKPLGNKGIVPEMIFINKNGIQVAVDAFTALAYLGIGKLPVTSTPLTITQQNMLDDIFATLEESINNIYQQGIQSQANQ